MDRVGATNWIGLGCMVLGFLSARLGPYLDVPVPEDVLLYGGIVLVFVGFFAILYANRPRGRTPDGRGRIRK